VGKSVRKPLGTEHRIHSSLNQANLVSLHTGELGLSQIELCRQSRANRIGKRTSKQANRVDSATSLTNL
jgi:hypothetical protein